MVKEEGLISTKATPSFVWVQSYPESPIQHQAELLEIRDNGYWVRWTLCNKEELIPLTSVLEQKLPQRRRRASRETGKRISYTEVDEDIGDSDDDDDDEEEDSSLEYQDNSENKSQLVSDEEKKLVRLSPSEQQQRSETTPDLVPSNITPCKPKKRQKNSINNRKKRSSSQMVVSNVKENRSNKKMNRSHNHSKDLITSKLTVSAPPAATTAVTVVTPQKGLTHPVSAASLSIWKLHNIAKAPAIARVAAVLEPHSLTTSSNINSVADLTASLFLFAFERQSSWHRRNNESNPVWSKSPIFQKYALGNVYRELDRGTTYLRSHVGDLYRKHCEATKSLGNSTHHQDSRISSNNATSTNQTVNRKKSTTAKPLRRRDWIQQVLWASYCYRQVNRMEPFQNFGGIPSQQEANDFMDFVSRIQNEEADKESLFFNGDTYTFVPSFDDYLFHLERLGEANGWLLKSIAGRLAQCKTMQQCWDQISKRLPGLSNEVYGDEISWQILCDLVELGCLSIKPLDMGGVMNLAYVGPKPFRKFGVTPVFVWMALDQIGLSLILKILILEFRSNSHPLCIFYTLNRNAIALVER